MHRFYHFGIIFVLLLSACGVYETAKFSSYTPTMHTYYAPALANAGPDRIVLRGTEIVLNGSGSYHPYGYNFQINWQQIGSGERVFLSNPTNLNPSFIAPLDPQTLMFRLQADDGVFQTEDIVSIYVKKTQPNISIPRVYAGPDRYVDTDQRMQPTHDDDLTNDPSIITEWEVVTMQASKMAPTNDSLIETAAIYRLYGSRDGFEAAPDYLLLYPSQTRHQMIPTPICQWPDVPTQYAPLQNIHFQMNLNAYGSNPTTWRWYQILGDQVLPKKFNQAELIVQAPARPQQLIFHVVAKHDTFESAPCELVIDIIDNSQQLPYLALGEDQLAHAGNRIKLDAQNGCKDQCGDIHPDTHFVWTQSHGRSIVTLNASSDGRQTHFYAPASPDDLSFVLIAQVNNIQSAPRVTRVIVLPDEENQNPKISLQASNIAPKIGEKVTIIGRIHDPESDTIVDARWTAQPEALVDFELVKDLVHLQNYDSETQIAFIVPDTRQNITIGLQIKDHLGAVSLEEIIIRPSINP